MKNTHIRIIIFLGGLTLAGIIATQVFWVSKAIRNEQEQFAHQVQMALRNVAESLCEINGNDISNDPIDQISSNYFIARTSYSIDLGTLDYLIKSEFAKRNLNDNYEYGVYDCQTQRMVYGDFVSDQKDQTPISNSFPNLSTNEEYYFAVHFPDRTAGFTGNLAFWHITSALTILITLLFAFALFVILRQRRLSEIQRDFVNNMTHEFKTPLSTLMLSAEALEQENSSARGKQYAQIVKSESGKLLDHVNRILESTVIEHNQNDKKELFDIVSRTKAVVDRFSLSGRGIQLDLSQQVEILGNPDLFDQVVFNLIDNAIKYGKGDILLSLSQSTNKASLSVSNSGEPISIRDQKRIFDKFYRVPTGNLHSVKGFGLGLHFVKQAMQKFGGRVSVSSTENETTFTLTFPLK